MALVRTGLFVVALSLAASSASAQTQAHSPADFGPSIALHITAVTLAVGSTACLFVGSVFALGSALGGSSGTTDPATTPLALTGGIGLLVAIGVGIAATIVHSNTRNAARRDAGARLDWQPLAWGDPTGAGAGLTLSF